MNLYLALALNLRLKNQLSQITLPYLFVKYSRFRAPPKFYEFHLVVEEDSLIIDKTLINLDKSNSY